MIQNLIKLFLVLFLADLVAIVRWYFIENKIYTFKNKLRTLIIINIVIVIIALYKNFNI